MPVLSDSDKAEMSAKVPREQYEEFRRYFPGYGGTTWFITTALDEFLQRVRAHPELIEQVRGSIDAMVQGNREPAT